MNWIWARREIQSRNCCVINDDRPRYMPQFLWKLSCKPDADLWLVLAAELQ